MPIDHINLARLDLNLLVALHVLLAERSVTRAGARLGIGQSAMSHNLARLRALFGDELLTRETEGMRPTPRALALADQLRVVLSQIEAVVSRDEAFDPQTAKRLFRIGLPDSVEILLGPVLLAHLCEAAPGIRLRLYSTDQVHLFDELDADHLDLAIGFGVFPEGQTHHKQRRIGTVPYLCMFNAERIGVSPPISLEDYVRLPHVLTSLREGEHGLVDDALAQFGLTRTVVLTTPRFLTVPYLVKRAPVVVTMHAQIAHFFAATLGLSISPPPVKLREISHSLLWHASYDKDPAHLWLRQTVTRLMAETVLYDGAA